MKINLEYARKSIGSAALLFVALTGNALTAGTSTLTNQSAAQHLMQPTTANTSDPRQSASRHTDDKSISARIKSSFLTDKQVKTVYIHVETLDGVVQLSGLVDTQAKVTRALEIASAIEGVKTVSNNILCGQEADHRGVRVFYFCNANM